MNITEEVAAEIAEENNAFNELLEDTAVYYSLNPKSKNPYDEAGTLHNQILGKLVSNEIKDPKKAVKYAFEHIAMQDGGFVKSYDSSFIESNIMVAAEWQSRIEKAKRVNCEMLKAIDTSDENKAELMWLLNTVLRFDGRHDSIVDKLNDLTVWENRIMASEKDANDKAILLATASVARHSAQYWFNTVNDEGDQNSRRKKPNKEKKRKCLQAVFTAAADVIGAIAGAVAGAPAGPAGIVIGAAVVSSHTSAGGYFIFFPK